ncbi:MAG: hypothetical protein J7L16_01335 [Deltaproteobacteria bacterium]|nr:hypothetical protein [Deltaproteobacteria bacterium]
MDVFGRRIRLVKQQKRELMRMKRIIKKEHDIVDRAQVLGIVRDNWDYYNVDIEEPVSYQEAGEILSQAVNTGSYYFKPEILKIKKDITHKADNKEESPSHSADSRGIKEGDIFLTLKGTFAARRR